MERLNCKRIYNNKNQLVYQCDDNIEIIINYDDNGNIIYNKEWYIKSGDIIIEYEQKFDKQNRLIYFKDIVDNIVSSNIYDLYTGKLIDSITTTKEGSIRSIFNENQDIVKCIDQNNNILEKYLYDKQNRVFEHIDYEMNELNVYIYNDDGTVTRQCFDLEPRTLLFIEILDSEDNVLYYKDESEEIYNNYDENHNLIRSINPKNNYEELYTYTDDGKLLDKTICHNNKYTVIESNKYDKNGNLIDCMFHNEHTVYDYDHKNNIVRAISIYYEDNKHHISEIIYKNIYLD